MKAFYFDLDARLEVLDTAEHYRLINAALEVRFKTAFDAAVVRIRGNPLMYAASRRGVRKAPIRDHFPYHIVYRNYPTHLWIIALAHNRQRPGYWSRRRP